MNWPRFPEGIRDRSNIPLGLLIITEDHRLSEVKNWGRR